jgi:hypothetical protein
VSCDRTILIPFHEGSSFFVVHVDFFIIAILRPRPKLALAEARPIFVLGPDYAALFRKSAPAAMLACPRYNVGKPLRAAGALM